MRNGFPSLRFCPTLRAGLTEPVRMRTMKHFRPIIAIVQLIAGLDHTAVAALQRLEAARQALGHTTKWSDLFRVGLDVI